MKSRRGVGDEVDQVESSGAPHLLEQLQRRWRFALDWTHEIESGSAPRMKTEREREREKEREREICV
jgi:hypothetical protein